MAEYPTREEVIKDIGGDMDALVAALPSYNRNTELARFTLDGPVSPTVAHLIAYMAEALSEELDLDVSISGTSLNRPATREEMENSVIGTHQWKMKQARDLAEAEAEEAAKS